MNNKQVEMIVKVLMDTTDEENPYRYTIQKINKVGRFRLQGTEEEDIQAYTYLLITELLNKITINEWNGMTDKERERCLISYCKDGFKKLSRNEEINNHVKCEYNKESGKYEYTHLNHVNIDDIDIYDNRSINGSTLTQYIFSTYVNESYLTEHQLRYVHTVINNYIDDSGDVRDINTNEILYSKQVSYKHKKCISNRLEPLIDKDPNIILNKYERWTTW